MAPSMKEMIEAERNVNHAYLEALTPEQIETPRCRWFHRWDRVDNPLKAAYFAYYQCRKCHDRKMSTIPSGFARSAPDYAWLRGKAWGWTPQVPTTKVPCSAVQPPRLTGLG